MGKSQKIAKLLGEKQKIEKKIKELQRSCEHPTKAVKFTRERLDSTTMIIRWVCNDCFRIVGYPSNTEVNKFVKK